MAGSWRRGNTRLVRVRRSCSSRWALSKYTPNTVAGDDARNVYSKRNGVGMAGGGTSLHGRPRLRVVGREWSSRPSALSGSCHAGYGLLVAHRVTATAYGAAMSSSVSADRVRWIDTIPFWSVHAIALGGLIWFGWSWTGF